MDKLENDNSSKRMMKAMGFSFLAYFIWIAMFAPKQMTTQTPSTETPTEENADPSIGIAPVEEKVVPTVAEEVGELHTKDFNNASLAMNVSSNHGAIDSILLTDHSELPIKQSWWGWLLSGSKGDWVPYSPGAENLTLLNNGSFIQVGAGEPSVQSYHTVKQKSETTVVAKRKAGGLTIEKTYSFTDNPNIIDIDVRITNGTGKKLNSVWVGIADSMEEDGGRFMDAMRPQFHADEDVESYMDVSRLNQKDETIYHPPAWFGLGSRYFLAAVSEKVQPGQSPVLGSVSAIDFGDEKYGSAAFFSNGLENGETQNLKLQAYIGPKMFDDLSKMSPQWGEAVEFGIFGFFSKFLLFILKIFYAGFNNWGIAILFLTLTMKVVFFPLTQKGYESGKKMQLLAPKMNELKEKYKDNSQLQAQEMMKLYREHGASPLGGCLPMLIQMPIWFALYNTLLYSVELYDSSFLYLKDLTSSDPYGILPVVYGFLMYATQKFMTPPVTENMGDQQKMMMKMMKWMPIMFTIFMFTFPSGLVLYFSCNSLLTILQQWLIKRKMEKNPIVLDS